MAVPGRASWALLVLERTGQLQELPPILSWGGCSCSWATRHPLLRGRGVEAEGGPGPSPEPNLVSVALCSWQPIMKFINDQYEKYLQEEININRKKRIPDTRVHCCIYFIPATGHSYVPTARPQPLGLPLSASSLAVQLLGDVLWVPRDL